MSSPEIEDRGSGVREDGAVFAPVQVRKARSPRILASVAVVALGGLIAIGAFDRLNQPGSSNAEIAALPSAAAPVPTQATRSSRPPPRGPRPISPGRTGALIALDVRPAGSHLFVHGDVFALDIASIRVRLEDAAGHVAATKSIVIPGGSTAFLLGAVPRFDAHFFLPDEIQGDGYIVAATAIDKGGKAMFTITKSVARSTESM